MEHPPPSAASLGRCPAAEGVRRIVDFGVRVWHERQLQPQTRISALSVETYIDSFTDHQARASPHDDPLAAFLVAAVNLKQRSPIWLLHVCLSSNARGTFVESRLAQSAHARL